MRKPTVRVPKGASWVRLPQEPRNCTHLLYQGVRWGLVYRPDNKTKLSRVMTRWLWYSENALGQINWGRTKEEAQRRLVRTLRDELKVVKELLEESSR